MKGPKLALVAVGALALVTVSGCVLGVWKIDGVTPDPAKLAKDERECKYDAVKAQAASRSYTSEFTFEKACLEARGYVLSPP